MPNLLFFFISGLISVEIGDWWFDKYELVNSKWSTSTWSTWTTWSTWATWTTWYTWQGLHSDQELKVSFGYCKNKISFAIDRFIILKVRTFWETHKIWKNLPLGRGPNHEEDFFQIICASQKVQTLKKADIWIHFFWEGGKISDFCASLENRNFKKEKQCFSFSWLIFQYFSGYVIWVGLKISWKSTERLI